MFENPDAEICVVGAMLRDPETVPKGLELTEADFTTAEYALIFRAIKTLYEKHQSLDFVSVGTWLTDQKLGISAKTLLRIAAHTLTTANFGTYVKAVQESTRRRKLRDIGQMLARSAEGEDIQGTVENARRELGILGAEGNDWLHMAAVLMKTFERINDVSKGKITAIGTGIPSLDRFFQGFYKGELTILAARPSVGKSAFGLFTAMSAAKAGKKVAIVSREMSPEAIGQRALSSGSKALDGTKIRKAQFTDEDWMIAGDLIAEMSRLPIYSIYTCRTMEDLHAKTRALKDREGLDLLVVDYAQLMHMSGRYDGRTEELEAVSGSLKELAMDEEIPVLALAQVKRSGMRAAVMPTMDELKGSGSFEQDADNVLLLHRPESENDDSIFPGDKDLLKRYASNGLQYIVVRVAKQRQGEIGTVPVCFDPAHNLYTGIARDKL